MHSVFSAEPAVLVHFEPVGGILFVFCCIVVALLALVASERDFYSHCGASLGLRDLSLFASLCKLTDIGILREK